MARKGILQGKRAEDVWPETVWEPLYTLDWFPPNCSKYAFDPYSFLHVIRGFIYFGVWGWWPFTATLQYVLEWLYPPPRLWEKFSWVKKPESLQELEDDFALWQVLWAMLGGIVPLVLIELYYKRFANKYLVERWRLVSGTSRDYDGESLQNVIGDIGCAGFGYYVAALLHGPSFIGYWVPNIPWWVPLFVILWYLITEGVLLYYIHDCGFLSIFMMMSPDEEILAWQEKKVEERRSQIAKAKNKKELPKDPFDVIEEGQLKDESDKELTEDIPNAKDSVDKTEEASPKENVEEKEEKENVEKKNEKENIEKKEEKVNFQENDKKGNVKEKDNNEEKVIKEKVEQKDEKEKVEKKDEEKKVEQKDKKDNI